MLVMTVLLAKFILATTVLPTLLGHRRFTMAKIIVVRVVLRVAHAYVATMDRLRLSKKKLFQLPSQSKMSLFSMLR
jgi:hypothetical protein